MIISGQYLTYTEYKALGGTLDEMPFKILELEARKQVDKYTFGRLIELSTQITEVKVCIFKLIEELNGYVSEINNNIASESIDGYSISYTQNKTQVIQETSKNLIRTYLAECKLEDGTPYLYRGV